MLVLQSGFLQRPYNRPRNRKSKKPIVDELRSKKSSKLLTKILETLSLDGLFLEDHSSVISSVAVTSDSKYVVSCEDKGSLRIWNIQTKTQEAVFKIDHFCMLSAVAITSDDKYFVSGGICQDLKIWSLQDKRLDSVIPAFSCGIECLAITNDCKYIVTNGGVDLIIWNFQSKTKEATLVGHEKRVRFIVITSDDRYIVSGGCDKNATVWNLKERRCESVQLHRHYAGIHMFRQRENTCRISRY